VEMLGEAGLGFNPLTDLCTQIMPEPTEDSVQKAVAAVKAGQFDGIVAVGGGSAIDSAKAVAVLAAHGGVMADYKVPAQCDIPGLPLIAVPTTAGTGSEATQFTIITDASTDEKMLCRGQAFMPSAAIVDYELSLTVPARVTADTGIDALTHAIEAYVSKKANPYSDHQALAAMRLIAPNLRKVYHKGEDSEAREAMMLGSHLAGVAFSNASVALVHGMSRPLGAHFHVPHGLSNAMLLPAVTEFSMPAASARYADCARAMGIASAELRNELANELLLDWLKDLNRDLQVPGPEAYGIDREVFMTKLDIMAEQAWASGSPGNNPRVPSAAEIKEIYRRLWA
ncbi:MAG: iron-containing alcohol dehydrogenase, partial [Cellvibrionaceae bacterium]|nr:iron-containing alcohol dehydrogenase [Cellvibrionaceae bacterium]